MPKSEGRANSPEDFLGQTFSLKIEKLIVGGSGLGRHEGLVVFVEQVAPGETVSVKVVEVKKNFLIAKLIEVLEPSPHRVDPRCSYFGSCGGCNWQHLDLATQESEKAQILTSLFKKSPALSGVNLKKIISSPHEFFYRNRVQMIFDGKNLCFRGRKTHDLIPIKDCVIAEEPIRDFIKNFPAHHLKKGSRYEIFLNSINGLVEFVEVSEDESGARFAQVNRFVNELITNEVLALLDLKSTGRLFEFYAGSGNFTFPVLSRSKFTQVFAVEGSSLLTTKAKELQKQNSISPNRLKFFNSDVESFLRSNWPTSQDTVLLDPPRGGATEFILTSLAHSRPRQIVYLSCHPVTLTRDLEFFLKKAPFYSIEFAQPFDMFPQTDHIECLVSLKLTDS
ncbi:MAG: class I SAM-dependent RNA methyltransferase [Bdellovibrionales bacterium]